MSVPMTWNTEGLIEYAKEHSIRECSEKYGCAYGTMVSYLRRHNIQHSNGRIRGKNNPLYKHGKSNTRLHRIWQNMKNRCRNPRNPDYKYYGGRGITVCEEWNDFICFEKWATKNGYSKDLTLDRVDVNSGYCPNNCRWVTRKVQSNNKRNLHLIEYKGEVRTLTQWSELLSIPITTLFRYLKTEKTLDKAIIKFRRRKLCVV